MQRLYRRSVADADVLSAIEFYLENAASYVDAFINELEQAYLHIEAYPASGSPRYAVELDIPELRAWKLNKFPFVIFYIDIDGKIEVLRVLHEARDIPSTLEWKST
jgi:toxin ParE1/3/4